MSDSVCYELAPEKSCLLETKLTPAPSSCLPLGDAYIHGLIYSVITNVHCLESTIYNIAQLFARYDDLAPVMESPWSMASEED